MPKLTIQEKIAKLQDEMVARINEKKLGLKEELELYLETFATDNEEKGSIDNLIKAIDEL